MLDIQIGPRTAFVPTHWNDLTLAQVSGSVAAIFANVKDASHADRLWNIAQLFLQVTPAERNQIAAACTPELHARAGRFSLLEAQDIGQTAAADMLGQLADQVCEFAFAKTSEDDLDENPDLPLYTIKYERTRNPLPHFELPLPFTHSLYAPEGDKLEGFTLLEYIASSHHYIAASNASNANDRLLHIARMMAVVYRSRDAAGQRIPFSNETDDTEEMAEHIRQMQPDILNAVWWWYACSYQQLSIDFASLFKSSDTTGTSRTSGFGSISMIYELSDGILEVDAVANKNLYDTLTYAAYKHAAALDAADAK